jgi:ribokinase
VASTSAAELVPSCPVTSLDSTAAGDAFNGALGCALGRDTPLREAVRCACYVGALSTTRVGAQPSLPTSEELAAFCRERGLSLERVAGSQ